MNIFIIEAFLVVGAVCSALHDLITHSKLNAWGDWFNPEKSWRNKYKNGNPTHGEKFLGSTTVFVFLTDGWHFTKFLYHSCWQLLLAIYLNYVYYLLDFVGNISGINLYQYINEAFITLINFLLIKSFFNVIFEYSYDKISKRYNKNG